MPRRVTTIAIGAFVSVLLLAAAAASSGDVTIWNPPASSGTREASDIEAERDEALPTDDDDVEVGDSTDVPTWLAQLLVVAAAAVLVLGFIAAVRAWRPGSWIARRAVGGGEGFVLPDEDVPTVRLDGEAARTALLGGTPRNGIVACWMQLERDAAAVGLARHDAETSTEYVERVVAVASVDAAPIGALAALFREARFSTHAMGEEHRQAAVDALARVEAALRIADRVSA